MPLTRSAIKKLRKDRKREIKNSAFEKQLGSAIKKAEKENIPENVKRAISLIDKAVKNNMIHKNKGSRLKSGISRQQKSLTVKTEKSTKTKTSKKPAAKQK